MVERPPPRAGREIAAAYMLDELSAEQLVALRKDVGAGNGPGPRPRLSAHISVLHSKSFLYGVFVWARRALNGPAPPGTVKRFRRLPQ